MADGADEAEAAPVPPWAVQVLQAALREYRYHSDYLPMGPDGSVRMEVLRGDTPIGLLTMDHRVHQGPPERHDLRIAFHGAKDKREERFTPHSLAQLKVYAPVLLGRICRYGMSLDPNWCEECTYKELHLAANFNPPPEAARRL